MTDQIIEPTATTYPAPRMGRHPVLLLDDESHVVDALAVQLRRVFEITTATSPTDALALVRATRFSAVVSDLRMPEMDGVTFLEQVKLLSPATARLLLTGHGDLASAAAAVNTAAVHAFLMKPCPAATVKDALLKAIAADAVDADTLAQLGTRAALGGLAGAIGHEMGHLLTALGGSIDSARGGMAAGAAMTPDDLAGLDLVKVRLCEHARHLRDLSKPKPLSIESYDLSAIVVGTLGLLEQTGILRSVDVTTELPVMPAIANVDRGSIEGALINLIKNAVEALEAKLEAGLVGGVLPMDRATIVLRVRGDSAGVRIEVSDSGCGIAPNQMARLFEPHRSTKATGSGIGLGIVRAAIERQGGTISVSSTVDVGTTFALEFPAGE